MGIPLIIVADEVRKYLAWGRYDGLIDTCLTTVGKEFRQTPDRESV